HVLARGERGERKRMMRGRRRRDRHRIEIVAPYQLERVRMDVPDTGVLCDLGRLVAIATANCRDVPAFRAKCRDVHLRAEADADDSDLALRFGHGNSIGSGSRSSFAREPASIMTRNPMPNKAKAAAVRLPLPCAKAAAVRLPLPCG